MRAGSVHALRPPDSAACSSSTWLLPVNLPPSGLPCHAMSWPSDAVLCPAAQLLHYASSFHEEIEDAHGYGCAARAPVLVHPGSQPSAAQRSSTAQLDVLCLTCYGGSHSASVVQLRHAMHAACISLAARLDAFSCCH